MCQQNLTMFNITIKFRIVK